MTAVPAIEYIDRWMNSFVADLLDEEPAILIEGPRGSGKSTLLRTVAERRGGRILDLDDPDVLRLVREDVGSAISGQCPSQRYGEMQPEIRPRTRFCRRP